MAAWHSAPARPRLPGCLTRTTELSDLGRTSPIQRLTRPRGGRYFKYRPPPVRTVHLWNASLAACRAAEARRRAAPRAWGVGCLSNASGQYRRPLLVVAARTPPLLRTAACRRAPCAWLTPSPFSSSLSNDARNMVVARRRLFSPWTRQPTGYGCILWAGKRRRRRGPSRRPHGPERASRQGCPPRKRRRASPRPSPTRRRSRRRGPPRSRGVAARAWASGLRHGAPKSQPAWAQLPDKSKRRPSPRPARSRPHVVDPTPKNEPRVDGISNTVHPR